MGYKTKVTRPGKMALLNRLISRNLLLQRSAANQKWSVIPCSTMGTIKSLTPEDHKILKEDFWDKNKRLTRPLSPHLGIYKWEMTMILSITHRGPGLIQSALMTGFAIFPFVTSQSYPAVLAQVAEMGLAAAPILFAAKFAVVWPVMFHLFNGLRHLSWDMGWGFQIVDLYKTGYTVSAISFIAAVILCLL